MNMKIIFPRGPSGPPDPLAFRQIPPPPGPPRAEGGVFGRVAGGVRGDRSATQKIQRRLLDSTKILEFSGGPGGIQRGAGWNSAWFWRGSAWFCVVLGVVLRGSAWFWVVLGVVLRGSAWFWVVLGVSGPAAPLNSTLPAEF